MSLGIAGIFIGIAVMYASPGNAIRIAFSDDGAHVSFLHLKLIQIVQLTSALETSHAENLLAMIFIVGAIKFAFIKHRGTSINLPCIYLLGALATIYSFIVAPTPPYERALFPASIFLIIALFALVNTLGLNLELRPNRTVLATILVVFCGMFFITVLFKNFRLNTVRNQPIFEFSEYSAF